MDALNQLFGMIWSILNETLGHQVANDFNSLLYALGFYGP